MKKIYLILLVIFFQNHIMACDIAPEPFCRTLDQFSEHIVLTGEIVSIDSEGIDVKIIDLLRGEEPKEIIRIWNGTDFECNGTWSMAASKIGALNDVIIIVLPKIVDKVNEWDVIGDYRRPNPFTNITELKVENGIVKGLIVGNFTFPPESNLLSMDYDEFKKKIIEDGDCSSIILNTKNYHKESTIKVNNPFTSSLTIQLNEVIPNGLVKLYSLTGQTILVKEINYENLLELNLNEIEVGLYVLEIQMQGRQELVKVVKQ